MIKFFYTFLLTFLFYSNLFAQCPQLSLSPRELPSAILNRSYEYRIPVYGGKEPFEIRIVEGILPQGISLSRDGSFSGTPRTSGEFRLTIFASDSCTNVQETRTSYTLFVASRPSEEKPDTSKKGKLKITVSPSPSEVVIGTTTTARINVKHILSAIPADTALINSPGISFIVDGSVEKSLSMPIQALVINGSGEIEEKIDIPREVIRSAVKGSKTILINRPFVGRGTTASSLLTVKVAK